eukprot:13484096-Alexandrium_andersonii.AAC.1
MKRWPGRSAGTRSTRSVSGPLGSRGCPSIGGGYPGACSGKPRRSSGNPWSEGSSTRRTWPRVSR